MSRRLKALFATALVAFALIGTAAAQQSEDLRQRVQDREQKENQALEQGAGANAGVAQILAGTTEQAAHSADSWGKRFGLSKAASFGISLAVNFAGIVLLCWVLLKSRLPQAFRERTAAIQKGIRDAQEASADATRRLGDIEARLSKLDAEVEAIRHSAESEAAKEEERIRQAAERDKQKIIQSVESEIEALARNARRELKGYAASLAVDLAARGIHVDEPTDQALVREFVGELGKDGR
jgi:F-type H+-transporting ATPase subunit b